MKSSICAWRNRIALVVFSLALQLFAHPNSKLHARDFANIINGYEDSAMRTFYEDFSSGIDHGLLTDISEAFLAKFGCGKLHVSFGDHRYYGHSWPFADQIPRFRLRKIEAIHPGAWDAVRPVWSAFCLKYRQRIQNELKLPREQANAFCAILYYVHILGDWDPKDNDISKTPVLMPCNEIVDNLIKNLGVLFRNHPEMVDEISDRLRQVKPMENPQRSIEIMKTLMDLRIGTKLHQTWGKYFEEAHPYTEKDAQPQLQKAA